MADENAAEAAVEAKEGAAAGGAPAAASGKLGMMVVIIVGFLVMAVTPAVTFLLVKSSMPQATEKAKEKSEGKKEGKEGKEGEGGASSSVIDLKPVNINIAETKGTRILRLEVHLVLSNEEKLAERLKTQIPMLTDRVIAAACRRNLDQLDGPEGHESLKRDIMDEINKTIKEKMGGTVIDVFFTEFIVQ